MNRESDFFTEQRVIKWHFANPCVFASFAFLQVVIKLFLGIVRAKHQSPYLLWLVHTSQNNRKKCSPKRRMQFYFITSDFCLEETAARVRNWGKFQWSHLWHFHCPIKLPTETRVSLNWWNVCWPPTVTTRQTGKLCP